MHWYHRANILEQEKNVFPTVLFDLTNSRAASKMIFNETSSGFLKSPCTVLNCSGGVINQCEPMHFTLLCLVWGQLLMPGTGYWLFGENKELLQWLLTSITHQTDVQTRHIARAVQRLLANQSLCLGSKWPSFTGLWCTCWGKMGCLGWISARRTLHIPWKLPAGTAETGTPCFPRMLLCKCSFDISHWDTFHNLSFTIKLWGMVTL